MHRARDPLLTTLLLTAFAALACVPLVQRRVPVTQMTDLPNHVRHVYEAEMALREGQFPPIVAPDLNNFVRAPLFQYYGGTAYLLPGGLAVLGLNAWRALGLSIFLHILSAGAAVYGLCRALGFTWRASIVAAAAFQLFPFAGTDLYTRGGYTQLTAMWVMPIVFYFCVQMVRGRGAASVAHFCLATLAWAFFIPQHPIQTAFCGAAMLGLLAAYALIDLRRPWPGLVTPTASFLAGMAGAVWFWYPVLRDRDQIKISSHFAFYDAGLSDLSVLLWPGFRWGVPYEWAPQLGFHFAAAAVLAVVFWRYGRAVGVASAVGMAVIVFIIWRHEHYPSLQRLLYPAQWSYRLLIPAALAGVICVATSFDGIHARLRGEAARGIAFGLALGYVVAVAPPYFASSPKYEKQAKSLRRDILFKGYPAPNSLVYSLRGTNFRDLLLDWAPGGVLRTAADLPVPMEGLPFDMRLVLRPESAAAGSAPTGDVRVVIDGVADRGATRTATPEGTRLDFRVKPATGLTPGDKIVRFEAPPGTTWRVHDAAFHIEGDPPDAFIRVPRDATKEQRRKRTVFATTVEPGREGLYQFPASWQPNFDVKVNRKPAPHPSADQYLVVVPLTAGRNVVQVTTRPVAWAWWVSVVTWAAAAGGALVAGIAALRGRGRDGDDSISPAPPAEVNGEGELPSPLTPDPAPEGRQTLTDGASHGETSTSAANSPGSPLRSPLPPGEG